MFFFPLLISRSPRSEYRRIVDPSGRTALHVAAQLGHTKIVSVLCENGADANAPGMFFLLFRSPRSGYRRIVDRGGRTALHVAANLGQPDIVRLLVEKGAVVNACGMFSFFAMRRSPVSDCLGIVEVEESTALHLAAFKGHSEIVSFLCENGADVNAPGIFFLSCFMFRTQFMTATES